MMNSFRIDGPCPSGRAVLFHGKPVLEGVCRWLDRRIIKKQRVVIDILAKYNHVVFYKKGTRHETIPLRISFRLEFRNLTETLPRAIDRLHEKGRFCIQLLIFAIGRLLNDFTVEPFVSYLI